MDKALDKALKMAKRLNEIVFIVYEDGYHVATDYDMDTFYCGCDARAAVEPNGEISFNRG